MWPSLGSSIVVGCQVGNCGPTSPHYMELWTYTSTFWELWTIKSTFREPCSIKTWTLSVYKQGYATEMVSLTNSTEEDNKLQKHV